MKRISILGSTGSIGTQALQVIAENEEMFSVAALSCARSVELLCRQIERFRPEAVCLEREEDALAVSKKYGNIEVYYGKEGLKALYNLPVS